MANFSELRKQHDKLRLKKAVWQDIADYLTRCLPADAGDPDLAIPAPEGFTGMVQADIISMVHAEVLEKVQACEAAINSMENVTIVGENNEQEPEPSAKGKPARSKQTA